MPLADCNLMDWLINNRTGLMKRFDFGQQIIDGFKFMVRANMIHADLKENYKNRKPKNTNLEYILNWQVHKNYTFRTIL